MKTENKRDKIKNSRVTQSSYILGIILALFLTAVYIWIFNTNLTLGFTDNAYHLAVAQGFSRAGGVIMWDFWNSLPLGRPQNYPPLFHLLLADLLRAGLSPGTAVAIMMEIFVVGGLALFTLGLTKLYNVRVAFFSVLVLVISVRFICASATIMPASMVLFLSPLLFFYFKEKKWISYVIVLTLMLYLHLFLPLIVLFVLAIYTIFFERKIFLSGLIFSAVALTLYCPWAIHIFQNGINNIKYFDSSYQISRYQTVPQFNLVFIPFSLFSIYFLANKKKLIKEDYFFLMALVVFIAMAFFATERTLSGHLWVYIAIFTAIFFDRFIDEINVLKYFLYIIVFFSLFLLPYLTVEDGRISIYFNQPSVAKLILAKPFSKVSKEERYQDIFSAIKNDSEEGEAIGTALIYFDNHLLDTKEYQSSVSIYMAANANRPSINLYQPEYYHRPLPDLTRARIVLLNEKQDSLLPQYFDTFGYPPQKATQISRSIKNDFILISSYESTITKSSDNFDMGLGENKNVYVYKNKNDNIIKETKPEFIVPFWAANTCLVLLVGLIVIDLIQSKKLSN